MVFFQRSINSSVRQLDPDRLKVESSFLDLEHSLHLEIEVRKSTGEILSARAIMPKSPFTRCKECVSGADLLVGMRVGRGIMGKISENLGGPRSCVHLVELVSDAVRLIGMLFAGEGEDYSYPGDPSLPEEEVIANLKPRLRNSCMVFADD